MTAVYEAGHIKRKRSTKTEMAERYDALVDIVTDAAPTGVRFCYYRAVSQGIVPKTNNGYVLVQRALMHLRETGVIPWESITDSSRWMRRPDTWDGVDGLLRDLPVATDDRYGMKPTPASKCGANPNQWPGSSGPSRMSGTCRCSR
jgi:hypothetical protein